MPRNNLNINVSNSSSIPMNPIQDPMNPFYVNPNENPAAPIVSFSLSGTNYHRWARAMRRALISKNKQKFVDGSIEKPDRFKPIYDVSERCNNLVLSWILNSVLNLISENIAYTELAFDAWRNLRERFSQADLVRISEIQEELYSFKQNSLSVTQFFNVLMVLWEEFDHYRPVRDCRCPVKCTCEASSDMKIYREQDHIIRFLVGLNDGFAMVRSQILLMDPLPPINKVFSKVLQHERQNGLAPVEEVHSMVNLTDGRKYNSKGKPPFSGGRCCTYCGRSGHTVEVCYKKHGYPPGSKHKGGSTVNNVFSEGEEQDNDELDTKGVVEQP